jgi:hypothetical protein
MAIGSMLTRVMDQMARAMHGRRLAPPTEAERELAREMRDAAAALPPIDQLRTADAWWTDCARQFRAGMMSDDPRNFTRWPVIHTTMFLSNRRQAVVLWRLLKSSPDFATRWRPFLSEVPTGSPTPLLWAGGTSGQVVWHAAAAMTYERLAGGRRLVDQATIVEWGGGYGGMCRLAHAMGFKGRYVIYDLPELSLLQRFYLKSNRVRVLDEAEWLAGERGVFLTSDLATLDRVLTAPNAGVSEAAFWATWSLSETPAEVRERILPYVSRMRSYFIVYQVEAAGVDNAKYFRAWRDQAGPGWRHTVEPVPKFGANWWSAGVRED